MLYRRGSIKYSKIKNINIIQEKLKQCLITKKDVFQQITLKVYQIGLNNAYTNVVVFSGNIIDTLSWCKDMQQLMKSAFDGYLNNIRNNSERNSILKFSKQLLDVINQSELYSEKCFKKLKQFIKLFSNNNPQSRLKDSQIKDFLDDVKEEISLYRKIVTGDRVDVISSLNNYYLDDKSENYMIGISGIQKAIDNNQILNINLNKNGKVRIKPQRVLKQNWILFGTLLDDQDNQIKKVVICQSDVKK